MEITEPVILQIPQGRKVVRVELASRADARDLIAAIARSMERLPDDGVHDMPAALVTEVASAPEPCRHSTRTAAVQHELADRARALGADGAARLADYVAGYCPEALEVALNLEGEARKPEPESVMTCSERTCDAKHPETGDWCVIEGGHDGHRDTYDGVWTTAEPASPEVAEALDASIVAGTPVLVTDDEPERPARPVFEVVRDGVAEATVYCEYIHPFNGNCCIGTDGHAAPCRDIDGNEWVPAVTA